MSYDDDQEYVRKLLRKKDKVEALSWLEGDESRNVGELSHAKSLALIRRVYKLGAVEIVAVEISAHAGFESTDTLIAKLPADRSTRRDILEWNNQRSLQMGYEADSDEGQDHVLIWFD
jgi:hypothetical protein